MSIRAGCGTGNARICHPSRGSRRCAFVRVGSHADCSQRGAPIRVALLDDRDGGGECRAAAVRLRRRTDLPALGVSEAVDFRVIGRVSSPRAADTDVGRIWKRHPAHPHPPPGCRSGADDVGGDRLLSAGADPYRSGRNRDGRSDRPGHPQACWSRLRRNRTEAVILDRRGGTVAGRALVGAVDRSFRRAPSWKSHARLRRVVAMRRELRHRERSNLPPALRSVEAVRSSGRWRTQSGVAAGRAHPRRDLRRPAGGGESRAAAVCGLTAGRPERSGSRQLRNSGHSAGYFARAIGLVLSNGVAASSA